MYGKARILMLTAFALAAPVLARSVSTASAEGLISIIVIDPANP
ncbi:MAG: D-ribose ABC transporter substrate-binding protein, partial [Mesorhizobium sp.]